MRLMPGQSTSALTGILLGMFFAADLTGGKDTSNQPSKTWSFSRSFGRVPGRKLLLLSTINFVITNNVGGDHPVVCSQHATIGAKLLINVGESRCQIEWLLAAQNSCTSLAAVLRASNLARKFVCRIWRGEKQTALPLYCTAGNFVLPTFCTLISCYSLASADASVGRIYWLFHFRLLLSLLDATNMLAHYC